MLIYRALGAEPPIFAHVTADSRHGPPPAFQSGTAQRASVRTKRKVFCRKRPQFPRAAGLGAGKQRGISPHAGADRKVFALGALAARTGVFDRAKLEWYNTQYLQKPPVEEVVPYVEGQLKRAGLWQEKWGTTDKAWLARAVDLIRPRTRLLGDFTSWARGFFTRRFRVRPGSARKILEGREDSTLLAKATAALEALPDWNHDAWRRGVTSRRDS